MVICVVYGRREQGMQMGDDDGEDYYLLHYTSSSSTSYYLNTVLYLPT